MNNFVFLLRQTSFYSNTSVIRLRNLYYFFWWHYKICVHLKYLEEFAWIPYSKFLPFNDLSLMYISKVKRKLSLNPTRYWKLNIKKISTFINRNLEDIQFNCMNTWETISASIPYHISCVIEGLTSSVRLNTQGAHAQEHLYLKMKPFYI